jgi:hypothetical protein
VERWRSGVGAPGQVDLGGSLFRMSARNDIEYANRAPVPRKPARPTLLVGGPRRPARCGATHRRAGIVRLDKTRLRR